MHALIGEATFSVRHGCQIDCYMAGSDQAYLNLGDTSQNCNLDFDFEILQEIVTELTRVLAEMGAKADEEEAEAAATEATT